MGLHHSPRIVTSGLELTYDAGDRNSFRTTSIATNWQDYGSNQAHYTLLGPDSIYIKNTYASWIGYYPAVVTSAGYYTVMFDHVADTASSIYLDNDGIVDNTYNTAINVTTTKQTFVKTLYVGTTGDIRHFIRRVSGGNITVTNFKYFNASTIYDITGNGYDGTLTNGASYALNNGGVITFDGSNDYITVSGNGTNNTHAWTADGSVGSTLLCFEIWIKSTDGSGQIISKPWNGNGRYNIQIYPNAFTLLVGTGVSQGPDQGNTVGFPTVIDGNWHQLVLWATSTQMGYYLDGGSSSNVINHGLTGGASDWGNSGLPLGLMSLYFYGESWSGNTGFSIVGDIAIFRKYSKVLSADEVLQNYNAQKARFGL